MEIDSLFYYFKKGKIYSKIFSRIAPLTSVNDFESLKTEIAGQFPQLSRRLKQVAEFAIANPNDMALETIATIARKAEVQPSTLIRFAKYFGFDGLFRNAAHL